MKAFLPLLLFVITCNGAALLDGVDDHLFCLGSLGSDVPLGNPLEESRTISLWFKRYNTNSSNLIIAQHATLINTFLNVRFNNAFTNRLEYRYSESAMTSEEVFASEPNIGSTTNVWTHLVIEHNRSTLTAQIWINGQTVSGTWVTNNGTGPWASGYEWYFGKTRNGFGYFGGELDEFCYFYNTYLNPIEIQTLYASRLHGIGNQLRSNKPDAVGTDAQTGTVACNPFDGFPDGAVAVTFRDVSKYTRKKNDFNGGTRVNMTGTNGPLCISSKVCSYLPNE